MPGLFLDGHAANAGIVTLLHRARNQRGELVAHCMRPRKAVP